MTRAALVAGCYLLIIVACSSCGDAADVSASDEPVWVDDVLQPEDRLHWPGVDRGEGREIPFVRGFGNGRATGYWFVGFATPSTTDSFWFCREGDTTCPLDEHRRLNWDALVGPPLFSRIPGDPLYSHYWLMWTVVVPPDFQPDAITTVGQLFDADAIDWVSVERTWLDFADWGGQDLGVREAILHCVMVLRGTTLEDNGSPMPDGSGDMLRVERHHGWRQGLRVEFFDFSPTEGVFPAEEGEARPQMPFANIYIYWRLCNEAGLNPEICNIPLGALGEARPVSERGLGQDITGDGDANDTNNVIGALPCEDPSASEPPYSPLWAVSAVDVLDAEAVRLVDSYQDGSRSDIRSSDEMRTAIEAGFVGEPVLEVTDAVPGFEGEQLFFDCPAPVAEGFVPFPCAPQ